MSFTPLPNLSDNGPGSPKLERLRSHWKAIVSFGIVSTIFGVLALFLSTFATLASVLMIGVLMTLAGVAQLAIGFRMRSWGRFLAYEAAGLVYLLSGLFAVFSPVEASVVLTLLLGAGLIATGAIRVVLAFQVHGKARSSLMVAGLITALLGLLIVLGWPGNSLSILGILLGIDLIFQGVAWTMLGWRLKATA